MTPDPIKSSVLQEIASTEPTPKWQFAMRNMFMWSLAIGAIAVGAIAIAVTEHRLFNAEWELRGFVTNSDLEYLLHVIPYMWLGLFILFSALCWQELRHTKRGYKFSLVTVVMISAGASLVGGTVLYAAGIGKSVEHVLEKHVPLCCKQKHITVQRWHAPEQGRFMGEVTNVPVNNVFTVVDRTGREWMVVVSTGTSALISDVATNTQVRILGHATNGNIDASLILPPKIPRAHMEAMKQELLQARRQFLEDHRSLLKAARERISE